jgi:hypothetical protein
VESRHIYAATALGLDKGYSICRKNTRGKIPNPDNNETFIAYSMANSCISLLNKGNKKYFKYSAYVIIMMVFAGNPLLITWLEASSPKHRNNKKNRTNVNKIS